MPSTSKTRKGIVYSISNQKGGVGKSTVTYHLAISLSMKGKRILVIDSDPQCNASYFLLPEKLAEEMYPDGDPSRSLYATIIDRKPLQVHQSRYENVDIVPSSLLLSSTDLELAAAHGQRHARIKRQLDTIKEQYDYILIDCPPALNMITLNNFIASDRIIVVVEPDRFSLEGIPQLAETLQSLVKEEYEHDVELRGFLINMGNKRTIVYRNTRERLEEAFGDKVYKSFLPYRADVKNSLDENKSMFERGPNDYVTAFNYFTREEFNI